MVLQTTGDAYCWGDDKGSTGSLGCGGCGDQTQPAVQVSGSHKWKMISTSKDTSCGVRTDNVAMCWGDNGNGQIGDNSTTDRNAPVTVNGGYSWQNISAGEEFACGVATDGKGYCWGNRADGRIGDGGSTSGDQLTPIEVAGSHSWSIISAGNNHACGVRTDGVAMCWGSDTDEKLGCNTCGDQTSPTTVNGSHAWQNISAGEDATCGVRTDGVGMCWGRRSNSDIGDGGSTSGTQTTPIAVAGGHTWVYIEAGSEATCGMTTDGKLYCWGSQGEGQVGVGGSLDTDYNTPQLVIVPGLEGWLKVFVTSTTYDGAAVGGVSGADGICQGLADANGIAGNFKAWLADSDPASAPATRFSHDTTTPYHMIDGDKVADNWADLTDGGIDTSIDIDETGVNPSGTSDVWTNTDVDGTIQSTTPGHCLDWTSNLVGQIGHHGKDSSNGGGHFDDGTHTCDIPHRLFCFQQTPPPQQGTNCINPLGEKSEIIYNDAENVHQFCNGNGWVAMATGRYEPNAVNFDGTANYLTSATMTGVSDGTKGTLSYWLNLAAEDGFDLRIYASDVKFYTQRNSSDIIEVVGNEPNNNSPNHLRLESNSTYTVSSGWIHVLASWDIAAGVGHLYINDVDDLNTGTDLYDNSDNIDYDNGPFVVGARDGPFDQLNGDLADLWIDYDTYIDFSVEANRRKFIDSGGNPVYLGDDGSIPTGSAPEIFLSGDTVDWHTNKGTGGGFTENGALTDAATSPSGAAPAGTGYFVLIGNASGSGEYDGDDLGGLSGANAECLSHLTTYNWLGKSGATLNSSTVFAWLCDESSCQDMIPNTEYAFSTTDTDNGAPATGGATFTTDSSGFYPSADTNAWGGATYFNRNTQFYTGRDTDFSVKTGETCSGWTTTSGTGWQGDTPNTNTARWSNGDTNCTGSDQFVCFVNPVPADCVNPEGIEGQMIYNDDHNILQYCDGASWRAIGKFE